MKKSKKRNVRGIMKFKSPKNLLLVLVAVVGLVVGTKYLLVPGHATSSRTSNLPVLYVHGYLLNTCPGEDPNKNFTAAATVLKNQGYNGSADMINYYACDSKGSNIQSSGDPTAYYPGGGNNGINGIKGGNTDNTDIRHISYQLAWYTYNKYSSHGQPVSIVAHSMGGLITQWMLYRVQAHDPQFPPYLYVQDAVTISTPYDGVNDGYNNVSWCPSSTQCREMLPGSDFLKELHAYGKNSQATNGTDWTAIGDSPCDGVASNPAGTSLDNGDIHKISYYAKRDSTPVCYSHTSYLTDTSTALNMPVKFSNPSDTALTTTAKGAHALLAVAQAIISGSK